MLHTSDFLWLVQVTIDASTLLPGSHYRPPGVLSMQSVQLLYYQDTGRVLKPNRHQSIAS